MYDVKNTFMCYVFEGHINVSCRPHLPPPGHLLDSPDLALFSI